MASKATGAIITTVVVLAVVVAVVLFLGKGKASAASRPSSGTGASPGGAGASSFSLADKVQSVLRDLPNKSPLSSPPPAEPSRGIFSHALDNVKSMGLIPTSNSGLPPPACPDGMSCAPPQPVSHAPRPQPIFKTQQEAEAWSRGANSF